MDDLTQGIAPVKHIPETIEGEKEFKPWHKPRKQFVRRYQWMLEAETLLDNELQGRDCIRCLTLPGEDMLDIRTFRDLCASRSVELSFLGLDDSQGDDGTRQVRNISNNELSYLTKRNIILPDNFSEISNEKSVAYHHVKEFGTFDVVNLDFCRSISAGKDNSLHLALHNLCQHQLTRETPWLLFITTLGRSQVIIRSDMKKYWKVVQENIDQAPDFASKLEEIIGKSEYGNNRELVTSLKNLSKPKFVKLFAISLGKWLMGIHQSSHWSVKALDSYWYRVKDSLEPNMLSLSFMIYPGEERLGDPTGIVNPEMDTSAEIEQAMNLLQIIHEIEDLDKTVEKDDQLWKELLEETEALLGNLNYPVGNNGYRVWAEKEKCYPQDNDAELRAQAATS